MTRTLYRLAWLALATMVVASVVTAMTASISLPQIAVDAITESVSVQDLAPAECAGMGLTRLITASGTYTDTGGSALIFGSAGSDTIYGAGNDCILGGGGDDWLVSGGDSSVLDGGPGSDTCVGGGAGDEFADCEVVQ